MSALETVQKLIAEHEVMVFSWTVCPYCAKAKKYLAEAGANAHVEELNTRQDGDALLDALNKSVTGWESVPQVFIKGKFIGGGDDTESKFKSGELKQLLGQ